MSVMGDRIRSEAAIADRPGQMARLEEIACLVELLEMAEERSRTCPSCKDVVPFGWTLDDHFNCNWPEDFEPAPFQFCHRSE